MDMFCRNLPAMAHLNDIILLSATFEQQFLDLETYFLKLKDYMLGANRSKCHFACSRVKYLGLWITSRGIEIDPDKLSEAPKIPPPRNVKQLQSFLQTCSWYRKFIPNFSEIARPLSNITKEETVWTWTECEQKAFTTLKNFLASPPFFSQADFTKPFIFRTDASNYPLCAVLLQDMEEYPIEYARRLLNSDERNYSTTEREALAVVWALNKFKVYKEGSKITIASDH
ncbi:Retrovirus-related Pol polyprotein from transposon opus [Araneus ventricosus]|uniref:RNA-directed DNA polymerase n=1 Tax=Araneus ventricosus TaxID=182803 RepID=A0A4Y2HCP6_ARAVE|nr:Retrovirus-related Pol polyprotein from transposon opus [Araneus ventricosus]